MRLGLANAVLKKLKDSRAKVEFSDAPRCRRRNGKEILRARRPCRHKDPPRVSRVYSVGFTLWGLGVRFKNEVHGSLF